MLLLSPGEQQEGVRVALRGSGEDLGWGSVQLFVVGGAEVRAEAVGGGGLAGAAVNAFLPEQELLSEVWVQLHKALE